MLCSTLRGPSRHPKWQLPSLLRLRDAMPVHGDGLASSCKPSFELVNSTTVGDGIGKLFLIASKQLKHWFLERYSLEVTCLCELAQNFTWEGR